MVGSVKGSDGIENVEQPLVAELADERQDHQVVEPQLGVRSALDF